MGLTKTMNERMKKFGDKKRESFERTTSVKLITIEGVVYKFDRRDNTYTNTITGEVVKLEII